MPPALQSAPPWEPVLFEGHCLEFAEATKTFFRQAIEPSCQALRPIVGAEPTTSEERTDAKLDGWESLRTAELEMHRSFALALGGMWERHFRQVLWHSTILLPESERAAVRKLSEQGNWDEMCKAFERIRRFPLTDFWMYDDLQLLHRVASAVRHGTGPAAKWVHDRRPDLFADHDVRSGWFAFFTLGGEEAYSVNKLDLPLDQLRIFKDAIVEFWRSIERLREKYRVSHELPAVGTE